MGQRHVLALLFALCVLLSTDSFSGAVCGRGCRATIWPEDCEGFAHAFVEPTAYPSDEGHDVCLGFLACVCSCAGFRARSIGDS